MSAKPSISFEFFPPKDQAGEERLWSALAKLDQIKPDFVSVTYGAGGSTRDRTIRITSEIIEKNSYKVVAHLTCVGSTAIELDEILDKYKNAGIKEILALRGDPTGGPTAPWQSTQGGFDHADQLVELAISKGFKVGVAAFPDGHPNSNGDFSQDIDVLIRKANLGATFATTQFFFDSQRWERLVEELAKKGIELPVIPGILPISSAKQLTRMSELNGAQIPNWIKEEIKKVEESDIPKVGIEIATQLSEQLLKAGAPGLHFYTMNNSGATIDICKNLNITN